MGKLSLSYCETLHWKQNLLLLDSVIAILCILKGKVQNIFMENNPSIFIKSVPWYAHVSASRYCTAFCALSLKYPAQADYQNQKT